MTQPSRPIIGRGLPTLRSSSSLLLWEAKAGDRLEQLLDLLAGAHKVVVPEVVGRVLDELDEGDEEPPGVRLVDDEPLDEHARDLLAHDREVRCLLEQRQQHAREVVRVAVGVAQLVGDGVEEEVASLRVKVAAELPEHVHARVLGHGPLALPLVLADGVRRRVEHERVDERGVVARAGRRNILRIREEEPPLQRREEAGRPAALEKLVELCAQRRGGERLRVGREDGGGLVDL
mmetsp:Transcript_59972/g.147449  ORF Transcript_59972/g.147449 Transcript_59972/m.147449 type:complete len:234 (-) Transcript_59972:1164-1865(-)